MKPAKTRQQTILVDIHSQKAQRLTIYVGLGLLIVLSLFVRASLVNFTNGDYTAFSAWYDFVKIHGLHSFQSNFSNYNPPYTYFLYIATILPLSKIVAIKSLLGLFDIVLAASVYVLAKVFRPRGLMPLVAAIATMFIPTVLATGVFWGQFDQLYVAFILFSLAAGLRGRSRWAWALFGVAISIKFQAIFFLPVLGIMSFKRIRWESIIWGLGAFLLLTLPPMLAGRSLGSLLEIYPNQAKLFNGLLTLNAPNVYQWVPNSTFPYLNNAGIILALVAALAILLVSVAYRRFSNKDLLMVTTLMLYIAPFLLPAMHERYFFPASIASAILFFLYPTVLNFVTAALIQVVTLFSYMPFLFGYQPPIAMPILSLFVLAIIASLCTQYLRLPMRSQLD